MASAQTARRFVFRYVYAMLAIIVIAVAVTLGFLYVAQHDESMTRDRIQFYHLESSAEAQRLAGESRTLLDVARQSLSVAGLPGIAANADYGAQIGYSGILHSMRSRLGRLSMLQYQYDDETFAMTLQRLNDRFGSVENAYRTSTVSRETITSLEIFGLTIQQFDRLHSIAADTELQGLNERQSDRPRFLAVLSISTGLGALTVLYLMFSLRRSLSRQDKAEKDLVEAEERLQNVRKLDALGQLVGGVAHDFNNLLTAILGNTELLQERLKDDGSVESSLKDIRTAGMRAVSLTQQLLTFSRRQKARRQILDLNAVLRDMEPILERTVGPDIRLKSDYANDLYGVELDPGQLQQVIINLVSNARDAMPDGGVLSIGTENADFDATAGAIPAGEYVKFTIADSGVGIDEDTRRRLFEPFFTTKEVGQGTGLGLSTVHGIVADSKGHIFVHSQPGEGAEFRIYVPRAEGGAGEISDGDDSSRAHKGNATILVVDDDERILRFVEKGLSSLGYQVLTAPRAHDALNLCKSYSGDIHVIVSDVVMSGMNGPVFMESARRLRPDAVAIFMSGYSDVLWRNKSSDGIPLVTKPFELERLTRLFPQRTSQCG